MGPIESPSPVKVQKEIDPQIANVTSEHCQRFAPPPPPVWPPDGFITNNINLLILVGSPFCKVHKNLLQIEKRGRVQMSKSTLDRQLTKHHGSHPSSFIEKEPEEALHKRKPGGHSLPFDCNLGAQQGPQPQFFLF